MDKNSRRRHKATHPGKEAVDPHTVSGIERLSKDAVDIINRALFEDWLQQHGSWDAFLKAAGRKKPASDDPPTKH